jgi:ubiquinone/menaquinone biosynthesis C-methylase UbiE
VQRVNAENHDAEHYDEDVFHHLVAERLVKGIPSPQDTVLDVGTGTGIAAIKAKQLLNPRRIIGVDIDEPMLTLARAKDDDIEWLLGPAVPAPVDDASVDLVLCSSALHLIGMDVMTDARRVLRPGGRIAFSVPSGETFTGAAFVPNIPIPRNADEAAALAKGFNNVAVEPFETNEERRRAVFLVHASDFRL